MSKGLPLYRVMWQVSFVSKTDTTKLQKLKISLNLWNRFLRLSVRH